MNLVIGGGITGLSTAFELVQQGKPCLVVEAGEYGGLIRSQKIDGFTLELGPNVFLLKEKIAQLLAVLGLEKDIIFPAIEPYRQYVWYAGCAHAVPRSPGQLLSSRLLSFREKVSLVTGLFTSLKHGHLPSVQDESVAKFFSRFIPQTAVQRILDPALRGIYGGRVSELSAQTLFPGVWSHLIMGGSLFSYMQERRKQGPRARPFVLRHGGQSLVSALQKRLGSETLLPGTVTQVKPAQEGYTVVLSDGRSFSAESVFVTTSGMASASFLQEILPPEVSRYLQELAYAPIAVAHVSVPANTVLPSRGFGVLFPHGFADNLMGIMFNSVLFPHVAPDNRQLLTLCFGGVGGEQVTSWSSEQLSSAALSAVERIINERSGRVLSTMIWKRAVPQLTVGAQKWMTLLDEIERSYPGLFFLGVDRGGVGVPDRVSRSYEYVRRVA